MADKQAVAEPFRSPRQAALFCALVLAFLALPACLSALGLYGRRDAYREMPAGAGPYAFVEKQVLDERGDIDMLFLASSLLWVGVDTPIVQRELARAEGRPVTVLTFGYNHRGEDVAYAILRDTLARRKVKTVVATMPLAVDEEDGPHPYAYHFLPYGEDPEMTRGLPLRYRLMLYAESVLGAPRHTLSFVRPNPDFAHPLAATLGANLTQQGFAGAAYAPVDRDPPHLPVESLIASPTSADRFAFSGKPLTGYQAHFLRLLGELVRKHGLRLIVLHVPRWSERGRSVVEERFQWSSVLGVDAPVVGVPPSVLFQGLSDDEITRLYYDEHLNASGAALFTHTITPALLTLHTHASKTR
jgi:hypothetical protein